MIHEDGAMSMMTLGYTMTSYSFYKLARLHYCFSQSQSHTTNGYPNSLFIIMSIIQILLCLWFTIGIWFAVDTSPPNPDELECQFEIKLFTFYNLPPVIIFFFYDLFTVFLYYWKIRQFNKINTKNADKDNVGDRIKFILNKLLFLTLILQFTIDIMTGALFIESTLDLDANKDLWAYSVIQLIMSVGTIILSFVIFVMVEHNLDIYLGILDCMDKSIFYCFCKSLIENARPQILENNNKDTNDNELNQSMVTKTQNNDTGIERIQLSILSGRSNTYVE